MNKVLNEARRPELYLAVETRSGARAIRLIGATAAWPTAMDWDSTPRGGAQWQAWRKKTFRQHLSDALGLPLERCHAINNANAAAMTVAAEQKEPEPGTLMCLHLASGIGLGTINQAIARPNRLAFIDAHLTGGPNGVAGEVGHCVLDQAMVSELNKATGSIQAEGGTLMPLRANQRCTCHPQKRGHLDAVFGGRAVLERLGRYQDGLSLGEMLRELRADSESNELIQVALMDVGRATGSLLTGAVAAADPISIKLAGALASRFVVDGLNERLRANNVSARAELYRGDDVEGTDARDVALKGAALAVLRGGLYRRFFENIKPPPGLGRDDYCFAEDWSGWEVVWPGVRTGKTALRDSAWQYKPLAVGVDWSPAFS